MYKRTSTSVQIELAQNGGELADLSGSGWVASNHFSREG